MLHHKYIIITLRFPPCFRHTFKLETNDLDLGFLIEIETSFEICRETPDLGVNEFPLHMTDIFK